MYFEWNLILSIITFCASMVIFIFNYTNYIDSQGRMERNIMLTHIFLLLSQGFFFLVLLFPIPDLFLFQLIPFIHTVALLYSFYVLFSLVDITGETIPYKHKFAIIIYTFVGLFVSCVLNYFYLDVVTIEGRQFFGVNLINISITIIYLIFPLLYTLTTANKKLMKHFTQESKKALVTYFHTLVTFVVVCLITFLVLPLRSIFYIIFLSIELLNIILYIKNPKILVYLGSVLGMKSIYIVRNNGMTIYTKDFTPSSVIDKTDRNRINLLIGGFVYAISHGIKEIIKHEYQTNLKSMNFGIIKLIFGYGEKVFGVLFTTSTNDYLQKRLTQFIKRFEEENAEKLDTWIGDITYMSKKPAKGSKDEEFVNSVEKMLKDFFLPTR